MEIRQFIQSSDLPDEDKIMWDGFLDLTDKNQQEVLADFLEDDENRLMFLTDNIKMKREALESGDPRLVDKILDAERGVLLEL